MNIRDRIKELRRVPASQLRPNPKNWKTHPDCQRDALRGLLAEIGFAGAALARELDDGTLELIDGHLRAETTPGVELPVLVLDVSAEEAAKILATYDTLGRLAETNEPKLHELLAEIDSESPGVQELLDQLREQCDSDNEDGDAQESDVQDDEPSDDEWDEALDGVPIGDHSGIQQMTFTLATAQVATIKQALEQAKAVGDFGDTGNPNANGNALARLAEAYLGRG